MKKDTKEIIIVMSVGVVVIVIAFLLFAQDRKIQSLKCEQKGGILISDNCWNVLDKTYIN